MENIEMNFFVDLVKQEIIDSVSIREGTELNTEMSSKPWIITVWERIMQNSVAKYSLHYTVIVIFMAVFYSALVPTRVLSTDGFFAPDMGGGSDAYTNLRHPFGTDNIGRDLLSLILAGTYVSMLVGLGSTVIFIIIGVTFGVIAGYFGNLTEEVILRFADFMLAIPFLLIAILALQWTVAPGSFVQGIPGPLMIMIILGTFGWAGTTRLVAATTKQVKREEYILAAVTMGASNTRIIFNHILPNILAPIIVVGTLGIAGGILSEAGLTFLGFGDASSVSWGTVIADGSTKIAIHANQTLIAGFAVFFIAIAINLLGDALRDALDPRLKA